jgi:hypothetical protein
MTRRSSQTEKNANQIIRDQWRALTCPFGPRAGKKALQVGVANQAVLQVGGEGALNPQPGEINR